MKLVRNGMLAALVALFLFSGPLSTLAQGQIMKQVPASALAVLKISNLQATSKKIADLAGSLGVAQMQPEFSDPLGSVEKKAGISQGLNPAGDVAFIYVDPATVGNNADKAAIILLPVSDYKAFLGNWPDAKTDGDITQVQFKGDADISYVANWGDYAAVSPSKDLVSKKPEGITPPPIAAKELDGKDFVFYGNMDAIRPKLLPQLEQGRKMVHDQIDQAIQGNPTFNNVDLTKLKPLVDIAVDQILNMGKQYLTDCDAATYSINLSPDGIATTFMTDFTPDSDLGKKVSSIQDTDDSLLAGLPDANKYLFFGGCVIDSKVATEIYSNFLDPITAQFATLGDPGAKLTDFVNAMKESVGAVQGQTFGLVAPTGQLGKDPLIQGISISRGDSTALIDSQKKMLTAEEAVMDAFGVNTNGAKTTVTPAATTIDGVAFDKITTTFAADAQTPAAMQAKEMMTYMYGPDGMTVLTGKVDDKTMLSCFGIPDAGISAAITAVKAGDDPLAKTATLKSVSAQLPTKRIAALYFPLDELVTTGLNYAKQLAMDMGVKLPDDLPPIGVTIATDGTAVRVDSFVPSQLMQALTSAGIQLWMTQHQGNGGGGPNGL